MDTRSALREARYRAGLTQRELARRAAMGATTVAAYETGRRTPSLATLNRLVSACGLELRMLLEPKADRRGAAIATLLDEPPEQRIPWELRDGWDKARWAGLEVRWGGPAAARTQGAPVGVAGLTVAVVEAELPTLRDLVEALGWTGPVDVHALRAVRRLPRNDAPRLLEIVLLDTAPRERQLVSDGMRVRVVALEDLDARAVDPQLRERVIGAGALRGWPPRPPAPAGGPRPEGRFHPRGATYLPEGPLLAPPSPGEATLPAPGADPWDTVAPPAPTPGEGA